MVVLVGVLLDFTHITYIVVSLLVTALIIILAKRFIVKQQHKDAFLKVFALLTALLHISPLWVDFLQGNVPVAADNMLFPIYFCNLTMYLLIVVAFYSNKETKFFKNLALIVAYSGIFGSLISLFYPEYYFGAESIFEYGVFKSMLSHSTMLIFSIYLFTSNYVHVSKKDGLIYTVGLLFFGLVGAIVNLTFKAFGLADPNAMYLQKPPISEVPFLNAVVIGVLFILIVSLIGYYSTKEERVKLKEKVNPM